jgi:hypothetical protein
VSNRKKLKTPPHILRAAEAAHRAEAQYATYWNGERCRAVRVKLRVEEPPNGMFPKYWARDLIGTVRKAVRVEYGNDIFYLDNEEGYGWEKVTKYFGSPSVPHANLHGTEVHTH